jgi:cation diffusion facilitator family transporter
MGGQAVSELESTRAPRLAMRLSLAAGFLMLAIKVFAYLITGSAAILSDAAESVVHVVAVSFAAYSLSLSRKPADRSHHYGHDKITFFSAGFEGAMIVLAAMYIIFVAIQKWITGLELERLGMGVLLVALAAVVNGALGGYLVWTGKRYHSLILVANGMHVLTDCWTSLGVLVGLGLVVLTGWLHFDPIVAILVAANILWSGGKLMRQSVSGLMDEVEPETESRLRGLLDEMTSQHGIQYHGLRLRSSGRTLWVEFHLLFPQGVLLETAHETATLIEERIRRESDMRAEVISHLETLEDHQRVHAEPHHEDFGE